MLRTYRYLPLLLLCGLLYACEDDKLSITDPVDGRIEVQANLVGPNGPVSAFYEVSGEAADTRVAARQLDHGFGRASGASAVGYLTLRGGRDVAPNGPGGCTVLSPETPPEEMPLAFFNGIFLMEVVTDLGGDENCFLSASQITNTLENLSGELGTEPGEVNFYISNTGWNPDLQYSALHPLEYGTLNILDVDLVSGSFTGVPGAYVEFFMSGGVLMEAGSNDRYDLTTISGRVFFEFRE